MRVATLLRTELEARHVRLDAAFYLGREAARAKVEAEGSRIVPLADLVASIHDGARLPAAATGIAMLRLGSVRHCEINLNDASRVNASAKKWVNVRAGDVLFARAAHPFRAAAVQPSAPAELAASAELAIIRPRPGVLPEYLAAVLCTPTIGRALGELASRGSASALPRLRLTDIQRVPIPLPARSQQEWFAGQYQAAAELTSRAQVDLAAVVAAVLAEISYRTVGVALPCQSVMVRSSSLAYRWDTSYHRGSALREALRATGTARPLSELAKRRPPSLQGLIGDDIVFVIRAEDTNATTYMVEGGEYARVASLSGRMRQRLQAGDVLLCSTGDGEQVVFVEEQIQDEARILVGSATFTALRFAETPRVFAVALSHPLVRAQLQSLSLGSTQRFVSQRDLDGLLVPVLGRIWREDFEERLDRAMQRRREALRTRAALLDAAETFVQEAMA